MAEPIEELRRVFSEKRYSVSDLQRAWKEGADEARAALRIELAEKVKALPAMWYGEGDVALVTRGKVLDLLRGDRD